MENKEIKAFRFYSGDMMLGETDGVPGENGKIRVVNPRLFRLIPSVGRAQAALVPVCAPFKSDRLMKEISVDSAQVMFTLDENELDSELVSGYRSDVSGIKIASPAQTAAIGSGGDLII